MSGACGEAFFNHDHFRWVFYLCSVVLFPLQFLILTFVAFVCVRGPSMIPLTMDDGLRPFLRRKGSKNTKSVVHLRIITNFQESLMRRNKI